MFLCVIENKRIKKNIGPFYLFDANFTFSESYNFQNERGKNLFYKTHREKIIAVLKIMKFIAKYKTIPLMLRKF